MFEPGFRGLIFGVSTRSLYLKVRNIPATPTAFMQEVWEQKLLKLLFLSRLPFRFIGRNEFRDVIVYARLPLIQAKIKQCSLAYGGTPKSSNSLY